MKILFDDILQYSDDCPESLRSAPLADTWEESQAIITLDQERTIDCVGIGYTDATLIQLLRTETVVFGTLATPSGATYSGSMAGAFYPSMTTPPPIPGSPALDYIPLPVGEWSSPADNGLYLLDEALTLTRIEIIHNGTFIGRLAFGEYLFLGCSPSREPGLWSTSAPRRTVSGQVVPGAGGVTGRQINVDVTYKIGTEEWEVIEDAHAGVYGQGFPVFVYFEKESHRFPWPRLYATNKIDEMIFQSSVNRMLNSRQFFFKEAF